MTLFVGRILGRRRFGWRPSDLIAPVIATLVAIWLIFLGLCILTYQEAWTKASVFGMDVASLIERDIERTIETYSISVRAIVPDLRDPAIIALQEPLRRKVLFDESATAAGLGSIIIADRSGKVVTNSRREPTDAVDVSDRDYFIEQQAGRRQDVPFISAPFRSKTSGIPSIALSFRLSDAEGHFDGIVAGTLTLDYFSDLFRSINLPANSTISLFRSDGTTLMRAPDSAVSLGRRMRDFLPGREGEETTGSYLKRSEFDGIRRLFFYHEVGRLPLFLTVGFAVEPILWQWVYQTAPIALGFLTLSAIILLLGFTLHRELVRRTHAEQLLQELAGTDGLTGLANRRRFDSALVEELRRAAREERPTALLMIDGDCFKSFNDTYGHVAGDEALRTIGAALRTCIHRPGDLVARYGGEEFVVLLPNAELAAAHRIAEQICQTIRGVGIRHDGSRTGGLTVSIGVAAIDDATLSSGDDLVRAADVALYRAKSEGRDCVRDWSVGDRHAA